MIDPQKTRLELGNAWMMCVECMAKLYEFDGIQDRVKECPYKKDSIGKCTDEFRY